MKINYAKSTNASRRIIAQLREIKLVEELSETDPRKPGYVSKKPRNQKRENSKTKGLDYSKCRPVKFETVDPGSGKVGIVHLQNRARSDKRVHKVLAWKVQWAIPKALRTAMGLPALPEPKAETEEAVA